MNIRQVKTLTGGEVLAESVVTEEKTTLISAGTVLKPEYLDLLSFLEIGTVCIEDPYEEYEESHDLISREKKEMYVDRVKKILETHIYHDKCALDGIVLLADDIVQEIMQQGEDIVFDMKERIGNLYEHTIMVTFLSLKVGQDLKLEKDVLKKMALGCLLHDLGIRYITVSYLNCDIEEKTPAEIFEFKKHTILAYSALEGEDWIDSVAKKMILSHHERKDGSGFPLKQKTKEIECNILQACDTFDCFISGMECKRVSVQQALEYLIEASDLLFERKIIKVIQRIIAYYPVGTEVKLSTGENGVVLRQTKNAICPVVAVLDKENRITKVRYDLLKDKKIFILQVI